eukprot:GHVQ01026403.1.p1 GENE.GHVQ01026403.1~~GHVQ01026403.1.p1  ORF type:complete len:143 (+),score=17.16 GHVQ01026403.1:442-870(+)
MSATPIGKGGCAVVWKAECEKTGRIVAVKQMRRSASDNEDDDAADRELSIAQTLFDTEGNCKINKTTWPGVGHIPPLYEVVKTKKDYFLVFEHAGNTLSNELFVIKGEFRSSTRVYRVSQTATYQSKDRSLCAIHALRGGWL